ncbi:hypothetical protein ACJ41O_011837 [Fusarium nematophilum]
MISILNTIIDCQNAGKWDDLRQHIQPVVTTDNGPQDRDAFIEILRSSQKSEVDSYVEDIDSQALAARLIKTEAGESQETTFEYQEIVMAWFADGRLSRYLALKDADGREARNPTVTKTPQALTDSQSTTSLDLRAFYHDYIACINAKSMEADFDHKFCQSTVTHNNRQMTIPEYITLITDGQGAIKGLHFDIQDVVVDNRTGQIAARLEFTGVPVGKWANAEPNGKSVRFHENVMYWLHEGKIAWIWSVVDLDSYRKQLGA